MSLIDFYCSGPSAESLRDYASATAYKCESHLQDGVTDINTINPIFHPDTRIRVIDENGKWLVDNAILVTGSSDAKRQEMISFWGENYTITLVTGIVSLVLGLGAGVAAVFVPPVWLKAVCIVASIALVIFSGLSFYRMSDASSEISVWKEHPAHTVAAQRLEAYQNGVCYAKNSALKERQVIHPQEVQTLYRISCDKMNRVISQTNGQDDQAKARFAEQFLCENPLDETVVRYAFDEHPLLHAFSTQFAGYKADIQDIQQHIQRQRDRVNKERDQLSREVGTREERALKPYKDARHAREKTCEANKRAALAGLTPTEQNDPHNSIVMKATSAYSLGMASAKTQYETDTARIISKFKREKKRIEKAHQEAIQTLENAKSQSLLPFFLRASDIFNGAYAVLKGQNAPKSLYQDPIARMKEASAPPGGPELFHDEKVN